MRVDYFEKARERRRISFGARAEGLPEPLQARGDRRRRPATEGLPDRFEQRSPAGREDRERRAFHVGVLSFSSPKVTVGNTVNHRGRRV